MFYGSVSGGRTYLPRLDRPSVTRTGQPTAPDAPNSLSRLWEFERHEAIALRGLDFHYHSLFAVKLSGRDIRLNFTWLRHRLAGNVQNDVAVRQSFARRHAVWIDVDDGDALIAGARDLIGRCQLDTEDKSALVLSAARNGSLLIFLRGEDDVNRLFRAVAKERNLDLLAGLYRIRSAW